MKYLYYIVDVMTLLNYPNHYWLIISSLVLFRFAIKTYSNNGEKITYKEKFYYLLQIALSIIEKEQS